MKKEEGFLAFKDLLMISMGQIIGAGIMTYTGLAIGITGRSVPFAFLLSAVLVVLATLPILICTGCMPFEGGQYAQVSVLLSKRTGGFFIILFLATNMVLSVYALSFAQYFCDFFGLGEVRSVAVSILTFFYVLNVLGVDKVAKMQRLILFSLLLAFAIFVSKGIFQIDRNYFQEDFFMRGRKGFVEATSLLSFATGGGVAVVNFSSYAKDPTKDLPRAVFLATVLVGLIYGLVSFVAAGVLPVYRVANKPLTLVARKILSPKAYGFFALGGAMTALISPLNSAFSWVAQPILKACHDGWFPESFGKLHRKYKTPVFIMTLIYVVSLIPILFGIDFAELGKGLVVIFQMGNFLLIMTLPGLIKKYPDLWEKSAFHLERKKAFSATITALAITSFQIITITVGLNTQGRRINTGILLFALLFSFLRYPQVQEKGIKKDFPENRH